MSNPFPNGLRAAERQQRSACSPAPAATSTSSIRTRARRACSSTRSTCSASCPAGSALSVGYTGLTGSNLSWGGSGERARSTSTSSIRSIRRWLADDDRRWRRTRSSASPRPARALRDAAPPSRSASCCGRSRSSRNVYMQQSTGAHSQYHAGIVQVRKRVTGLWGGNFSYTYSRLNDNQFGEGNYYSSAPGLQNNYTVVPGSPYYNPDQEYGRSLLDSPHKVVIAPTLMLPFGEGTEVPAQRHRRRRCSAAGRSRRWSRCRAASRSASARTSAGDSVPLRRHVASQHRAGRRTSYVRATSPIASPRTRPTTSISTRRRSRLRRATRSATRRARSRASTRRGATTSTCRSSKNVQDRRRHVGDRPARSAQHVQHRAVGGAGELAVRQLVVRPDHDPGEQHADDSVHAALPVLIRR